MPALIKYGFTQKVQPENLSLLFLWRNLLFHFNSQWLPSISCSSYPSLIILAPKHNSFFRHVINRSEYYERKRSFFMHPYKFVCHHSINVLIKTIPLLITMAFTWKSSIFHARKITLQCRFSSILKPLKSLANPIIPECCEIKIENGFSCLMVFIFRNFSFVEKT